MPHEHKIHDSDAHFVIDPVTRQLSTTSKKVTLIQYDHNSERFTFELPRYVEGHDMSLIDLAEVHYINASGSGRGQNVDIYPITDLQVSKESDDVVICSWLISQNATQLSGSLTFGLRFACVNEFGDIVYQWSTVVYTNLTVVQGLNNSGEILADVDSSDVLASWKDEIVKSMSPYIQAADTDAKAAQEFAELAKASAANASDSAAITEANAIIVNASVIEARASETNAANSSIAAASSSQAAAISAQAAATSADSAQNAERRASAANDTCLERLREASAILAEVESKAAGSTFNVNFVTGNLECTSASYDFTINPATGKLEWEVS